MIEIIKTKKLLEILKEEIYQDGGITFEKIKAKIEKEVKYAEDGSLMDEDEHYYGKCKECTWEIDEDKTICEDCLREEKEEMRGESIFENNRDNF